MNGEEKSNQQITIGEIDELRAVSNNGYAHGERPFVVRTLLILLDIVLASSPLLFLGIACAAIAYNGKLQDKQNLLLVFDSSTGQYVQREATGTIQLLTTRGGNTVIAAAAVAVSLFPIIFAAIVGRFLKSYAMYRAERGASMGMLEQFYGSQSLANAVQLTYALRGSGMLGLAVVILWLLSPLGGQATQRVLSKATSYNSSMGNVYYTNTSAANGAFANHFYLAQRIDNLYAVLSAALLSDSITTDNDIWGNVRIPYFESLDTTGYDAAKVASGLETLSASSGSPSSSMIGLLVNNVTNMTSSVFTTKTSYLNLTCEGPRTWNYSGVCEASQNGTDPTQEQLQPYYDFLTWANLFQNLPNASDPVLASNDSDQQSSQSQFWSTWSFDIGFETNGSTNATGYPITTFANPPTFVYSAQRSDCLITAYKCPSRVVWVESDIACEAGGVCSVIGMRNSTRPEQVEVDSIFDQRSNDGGHGFPLDQMLGTLNVYSSSGATGITNPIQWYVTGSQYPFHVDGQASSVDYSRTSADLMSNKLGTLLNTFWMIGLQYGAISQPRSTNASLIADSENNSTTYGQSAGLGYDVTGALAQFYTSKDIYAVNWPFVIIAIIISLMLMIFGFVGMYLRHSNTNPDVLGYVSTLTRENPNFSAPIDAHKSDGLEMAAYYKKVKVQLVSTTTGNDGGRITLRPLQRTSA